MFVASRIVSNVLAHIIRETPTCVYVVQFCFQTKSVTAYVNIRKWALNLIYVYVFKHNISQHIFNKLA